MHFRPGRVECGSNKRSVGYPPEVGIGLSTESCATERLSVPVLRVTAQDFQIKQAAPEAQEMRPTDEGRNTMATQTARKHWRQHSRRSTSSMERDR
jgi:hypothetical protein